MLKEALKLEIEKLNEEQLQKIADFIALVQAQSQQVAIDVPFWQSATPLERSQDLRKWVSQLPQTSLSLPDAAFDRASIYDP